jgi:hypothetical protein
MTGFLQDLKTQRWDDHRYYHHSRINQSLHLVSAISFLCAYVLLFTNPVAAALAGWLAAMTSRQIGHFFFEPKGYDPVNHATHEHKEAIKVGYNLQRKVVLIGIWAASPIVLYLNPNLFGIFPAHHNTTEYVQHVGQLWLFLAAAGLIFRTVQRQPLRRDHWRKRPNPWQRASANQRIPVHAGRIIWRSEFRKYLPRRKVCDAASHIQHVPPFSRAPRLLCGTGHLYSGRRLERERARPPTDR